MSLVYWSYNFLFLAFLLSLNENFNGTLWWLLFSNSNHPEVHFCNLFEVFYLEGLINLILSLSIVNLAFTIQVLVLFCLNSLFYFETVILINKVWSLLIGKVLLVLMINFYYFNLLVPLEQNWSNETFSYSPFFVDLIPSLQTLVSFLIFSVVLVSSNNVMLISWVFLPSSWFITIGFFLCMFNYFTIVSSHDLNSKQINFNS